MLLLCRQKWVFTFCDHRDTSRTIGDRPHASAAAVSRGDYDAADQF